MLQTLFLCLASIVPLATYAADSNLSDILIADFEGPDYGDWKVEGEAFGPGPAQGTLPGQMPVSGYMGKGLVNSFYGGDGPTGRLTSPEFKIECSNINFLIGGGKFPGITCMNLLVKGEIVRTATGPNSIPGGTERLKWASWDVEEFIGQQAILEIVDQRNDWWGHINIDHIIQNDISLGDIDMTVEMTLNERYINFPVRNGSGMHNMKLEIEGGVTREFTIELAPEEPEYWVFMDVEPFIGKKAVIHCEMPEFQASTMKSIVNEATIRGTENLYKETLRPQFHFSSRRGWINDPNGLVYYAGEYHLFYQHNPYGTEWGNMHWGHAVSPDLVHWTELPIAIYPDPLGPVFSGSAVIDWKNTAGFQTGEEPAMVAMYTAAGQQCVQSIAYSNDRGRTFKLYEGNPVIDHIIGGNRDPKVIWYEPEQKWVMALYMDQADFALFCSDDLKSWTRMSDVEIPGCSECPEFFEIGIEGKPGETRWVMYGGNGLHMIGTFDGTTFKPESGPNQLHHGTCFYASQTYNEIPEADGRRILIAWGQVGLPGMPFNQMMSFPIEITLHETANGLKLYSLPVREIALLHNRLWTVSDVALNVESNPLAEAEGELLHIKARIAVGNAKQVELNARGAVISWDAAAQQIKCFDRVVEMSAIDGVISLEVLVDRVSVEIFGNDGEVYMPMSSLMDANNISVSLIAQGGTAKLLSAEVYQLKSTWE